jgi:hypothetical protein
VRQDHTTVAVSLAGHPAREVMTAATSAARSASGQ